MAITKLNKTYVNNQTKLNATDFQQNVDKIDELVDQANNPGIYRISENLDTSTANTVIDLSGSLNTFDFVIFATGAIGSNTYMHHIAMPYSANFVQGERDRADSGSWVTLVASLKTETGKIVISFPTASQAKINSATGSERLRAIYGIRLY